MEKKTIGAILVIVIFYLLLIVAKKYWLDRQTNGVRVLDLPVAQENSY